MATLPPVLAKASWRRSVTPEAQSAPAPPRPPSFPPPSLVWHEGERERFLGAAGKVTPASGEVEERWFRRLLDACDQKRPVLGTDLARLNDEHLAEVAESLDAAAIDAQSLRLLLARLEDGFLTEAVALARAAPRERGLFEAVAPVRAAELARTAAGLAEGPEPHASAARAWLLRFPDAATSGLVSLALGGDATARAALVFLAASGHVGRGRLPEAEPILGPAIALSHCRDARLASLLAWGKEREVLDVLDAALQTDEDVRAAASWMATLLRTANRPRALAWFEAHRSSAAAALADVDSPAAADARAWLDGDLSAGDPSAVPALVPELPSFLEPSSLAPPVLKDGDAFPPDAIRALLEMVRVVRGDRSHAAFAQVREACTAESLDAFARSLLDAWTAADEPPKENWILDAVGKLGGDATAGELATRIRGWARGANPPRHAWDEDEHRLVLVSEGDRGFGHARLGCAALHAMGTDLSRMLLADLARSGGASWLRKEALALSEGATAPTQRDPVAPNLGLDARGELALDLGREVLRVTFDEALVPILVAPDGRRSRTFPRTLKADDATKVATARDRFKTLARDAKSVARHQLAILETAMLTERRWRLDAFREHFVDHPLLRHLARRLVWSSRDGEGTTVRFRVAEDGTFATVHDDSLAVGPAHEVLVVHPISLGAELADWARIFGDYQLLQPFPQLGRPLFRVTDDERDERSVAEAAGVKTSRGRLFNLVRRGWQARFEDGVVVAYDRDLPGNVRATIAFDGGVPLEAPADALVYPITKVVVGTTLGRLSAIAYSELRADLEALGAGKARS